MTFTFDHTTLQDVRDYCVKRGWTFIYEHHSRNPQANKETRVFSCDHFPILFEFDLFTDRLIAIIA